MDHKEKNLIEYLNIMSLDDSEIPDSLIDVISIEESIFNANDVNLEKTIEILSSFNAFASKYTVNVLFTASKVRRFSFHVLAKIFSHLSNSLKMIDKSDQYFIEGREFYSYLLEIGREDDHYVSLTPSDLSNAREELLYVFPLKSVEYSVISDDIDSFLFHTASLDHIMERKVHIGTSTTSLVALSCLSGSLKIFKYFITNGAVINEEILSSAVKGGNVEIVELLYQRDFSLQPYYNESIKYHRMELLKWFIGQYPININCSIVSSISNHCNTLLTLYLINKSVENGNEFNPDTMYSSITKVGNTSLFFYGINNLHICPSFNTRMLFSSIRNGMIEAVKFILENSTLQINTKDSKQNTPLIDACRSGFIEIVKYLISKGADIHIKNKDGYSALLFSVVYEQYEIAKYLIDNGANIEDSNKDGRTVLAFAVLKENIPFIKYLIEKGVNTNRKDRLRRTPFDTTNNKEILSLVNRK